MECFIGGTCQNQKPRKTSNMIRHLKVLRSLYYIHLIQQQSWHVWQLRNGLEGFSLLAFQMGLGCSSCSAQGHGLSDQHAELLWALLEEGEFEDMKKLNLEGFDWNSRHPVHGQTLLVVAIRSGMTGKYQEGLNKIEWLIRQGASLSQKCTGGLSYAVWNIANPEATRITVQCKYLCAVDFVQACRRQSKGIDSWKNTIIWAKF